MPIVRTVVENRSRFPIEVVWENAQDLEHVGFLHANTNRAFELMHHARAPGSQFTYDTMVYRSKRKLFCFSISSFGFRRIVDTYNLHQVEHIPLLGITSFLNSQLVPTGDAEFPTLMRDEVIMEVPRILYPMRKYLAAALKRHATIQCAEDEPFRARRTELARRGIHMPYRIFFESTYEKLFQHVQCQEKACVDANTTRTLVSQGV